MVAQKYKGRCGARDVTQSRCVIGKLRTSLFLTYYSSMLLFQTTIEKSKPMDVSVPPLNNINLAWMMVK